MLPTSITVAEQVFHLAKAVEADLPELVGLLTDDVLGAEREGRDMQPYRMAFQEIDGDPQHCLLTVRDISGVLVGTMQLTLIPGLSRGGAKRLQLEGVRVGSSARGAGLGAALFEWAHEYGRNRGAVFAQLTTDKRRSDAHRFYARLGYEPTHEGFKLAL